MPPSQSAASNRYSDILAYWKKADNAPAQQRGHDLLPEDFDCERLLRDIHTSVRLEQDHEALIAEIDDGRDTETGAYSILHEPIKAASQLRILLLWLHTGDAPWRATAVPVLHFFCEEALQS